MIKHYYSNARTRVLEEIEQTKVGSWTHLIEPSSHELDDLAADFDLDRDLLNDAIDIYEAPRSEVDGDKVYIFTRYCHPAGKDVATEPLLIIYTPSNIITVMRHDSGFLKQIFEAKVEILTTQRTKTLLRILEQINRSYAVQLTQVSKRILQTRARLRHNEITNVEFVNFIDLEEDLNEFLTALQPQAGVLLSLKTGRHIKLYEDDQDLVEDLTLGTSELVELTKSRLRTLVNIRQAYDTIATNNLNTTFKRLTSIGIFMTVPMIASGIYGMNVILPFQQKSYAFWLIIVTIVVSVTALMYYFKQRKWL